MSIRFSKILKVFLAILVTAGVIWGGFLGVDFFYRKKDQNEQLNLTAQQMQVMQDMPEAIEAGRRVLGGEFANNERYVPLLAKVVAVKSTALTLEEVRFGMPEEGEKTSLIERSLSEEVIVVEVEGLDEIAGKSGKFSSELSQLSQKEIPLSSLQSGDVVGLYQDRSSDHVVKIIRFPREIVEKLPLNL